MLGEARLEAMTKVVERGVTVAAYAALVWQGSTSATAFTAAFLLGALTGWVLALWWLMRTAPPSPGEVAWSRLGEAWFRLDRDDVRPSFCHAPTLRVMR